MTYPGSHQNNPSKVMIALSGGVDSAVAAALLVRQGYNVQGVTLHLWSEAGCEQENRCCTPETRQLAQNLCRRLEIPFNVLDTTDVFRSKVVQRFLDGFAKGETPNPCIFCNQDIKWGFLHSYARSAGADFIATGHYARINKAEDGKVELWRAADHTKDQTYFLARLNQVQLTHTIFPLGDLYKEQVYQMAAEMDLPSADQPESQDLCFLGGVDFQDFIQKYQPELAKPGPVINTSGEIIGEHQGLASYTIGQRKSLPPVGSPIYVLKKDLINNTLQVGSKDDLGTQHLIAKDIHWISGQPPDDPFSADVKIRSGANPVKANVRLETSTQAVVRFEKPLYGVAPGQFVAFYSGERVLGGGDIAVE